MKDRLAVFGERRSQNIIIEKDGAIIGFEKMFEDDAYYVGIDRYFNYQDYARRVPPEEAFDYLDYLAEGDYPGYVPEYYEEKLDDLIAKVGSIGLELSLRFSSNGARFSTLEYKGDAMHGDERMLSLAPSVYSSIQDADSNFDIYYKDVDKYQHRR